MGFFIESGFLGAGAGGGVSSTLFIKRDGRPAIFATTGDRDSYFAGQRDDLKRLEASGDPVAIGTPNDIKAVYVYKNGKWIPAATNLMGNRGRSGQPGLSPHIGPNGNWFVGLLDTGVNAADGIDTTHLQTNEIVKWDSTKNKLVATGIRSDQNGEMKIAPDTLIFGNHSMAAAVENVGFRNNHSDKVYVPLWQEMAAGENTGYVRQYSSKIDRVVRVPDGNTDVTNPINLAVTIDVDEIFLGGTFTLSQPATSLMIQLFDHGTHDLLWQQRLGDKSAGKVDVNFTIPFDVKTGYQYDVKLISKDGSDVIAKSHSSTGFSWTINRAKWVDVPVATQQWTNQRLASLPGGQGGDISSAITHVSLTGHQLTFTHGDGAKHVVNLPSASVDVQGLRDSITVFERDLTNKGQQILDLQNKYGQVEHQIDSLKGTYSYDGTSLPAYPDDPKHSYFIHLHGTAARIISLGLPNPTNGQPLDGTMYVLGNANQQATVQLSPATGQTIEGSQQVTIPPSHYIVLVKSGTNWVKIIDSSLAAQQVPMAVTADQITTALDRGSFTGIGSIKTLQPGWWVIPATNKNVTGRPSGSQGDLVVYKAKVGKQNAGNPQYGVNLAFGQDRDGNNQAWAEYRLPSGWTPWFPMYQAGGGAVPPDLTAIQQEIAQVKQAQSGWATQLNGLQTQLGNVFAPTKTAFDDEANKLINAAIQPLKSAITSLENKQASMPADVEAALVAKGWGPLKSGSGQHGGGGDHHIVTLPKIIGMFSNNIPASTTANNAVESTTGTVTLLRVSTTRMRAWVLVENDAGQANKVTGISVNGGLAAAWQPRDLTIDGHKYRAFYSAGAYTEKKLVIKVNFE